MAPINFHSHDPEAPILSLRPSEYVDYEPRQGQLLTVGIHPWDSDDEQLIAFDQLSRAIADPRVVAVGEVGIDTTRGADLERQIYLLKLQLRAACDAGLPVVFHIVRRYDLIIGLHRQMRPAQPWGVHAFRGKPEAVRQLAREGIYMSVGHSFNVDAVREIPDRLLLLETDESPDSTMPAIVGAVAVARGVDPERLERQAALNLARFYGL